MKLDIYPWKAAISMEMTNFLLDFCIKKGGSIFEMEFYGPPDDVKEDEASPELFISQELIKKAKLVKKGKKDKEGGYLGNVYYLKAKIDKEFTEWFKEHNLMGFGFLNMTLYNKTGEKIAYFADAVIGIDNIGKEEITKLKKQLKPFEKNLKYEEE